MRIIKVSATASSNLLAREWYQENPKSSVVCFVAGNQTQGRGQRGAGWISNAGENLTFSVLFPTPGVKVKDQFQISAGTGLTVLAALRELNINNLKLKWPNDIMAANKKIGGILIENILSGGSIGATIIGIGLNINQTVFPELPKAGSLKMITGANYDVDEVLHKVLNHLSVILQAISEGEKEKLMQDYEDVLFRKNKVSTFQKEDNSFFTGIIKGVTPTGLLQILLEDDILQTFELKQLKLLY